MGKSKSQVIMISTQNQYREIDLKLEINAQRKRDNKSMIFRP